MDEAKFKQGGSRQLTLESAADHEEDFSWLSVTYCMHAVQVDLRLRQAQSHAINQKRLAECDALVVFRSNSLQASGAGPIGRHRIFPAL